ncbi:FkbM family methyltransferase [Brevibacillus panacihumi]|uniref:FkbM family methyltransferase n=1 Tax=Brevibacillus panacihumi TaxID=497735 RepID=UPI003D1AF338
MKDKAIPIEMFLDRKLQTYIMGINSYADKIIEVCQNMNLNLKGIIDDFTDRIQYKDYPIYKTEDVSRESVIISCVIDGRLVAAMSKLEESKFRYILNYFHLVLFDESLFPHPRYCLENRSDILANIDKYRWLDKTLADEKSRYALEKIVDFRFNYNIDAMRSFTFDLDKQYFDEEIIIWGDKEVFVDCGGFDGGTTKSFIKHNPGYSQVYYFEPSPAEFALSRRELGKFPRVDFHNCAIYKTNTVLRFDSSKGSASSLSYDGTVEVPTVRLDDVITDRVTMIKMDIEGAEYESLEGATRIIKEHRPKLAICVYHSQKDFWRIPERVLGIRNDYRVYLRHYTEGILETVMYFV